MVAGGHSSSSANALFTFRVAISRPSRGGSARMGSKLKTTFARINLVARSKPTPPPGAHTGCNQIARYVTVAGIALASSISRTTRG